jgi:glycosyltransferase involved in cell wall biosynthesis
MAQLSRDLGTAGAVTASRGDHLLAIPCFNHRTQLGDIITGARRYFAVERIIVVDDGSVPPLRREEVCGAVLLRHEHNCGLSAAVGTAARYALAINADGLIKLDADGQMDTEALPRFRAALDEGYQFVLGTFDPARTPASERFADGLFCLLFWLATGCRVPTVVAEYRAYGPNGLRVLASDTSIPAWASPLTLFDLRRLPWCTVNHCVRFFSKREFPRAGMLELRVMFIRYLVREKSLRAGALVPIAAAALFAHMGCLLVGRAVRKESARIREFVLARF